MSKTKSHIEDYRLDKIEIPVSMYVQRRNGCTGDSELGVAFDRVNGKLLGMDR
jgi:hypothetical protein